MPPCDACNPPGPKGGPKRPPKAAGEAKAPHLDHLQGERAFKVYARRVKISGGTSQFQIVASVPAAAAVDVFIRYRDDSGNVEDPFGSHEVWRIFAVNETTRMQIGQSRETGDAAGANADDVERRLFAIRGVPAVSFDLEMKPTGVAAGNTAMFDVVVVAWGREPTGVGPFQEQTFFDDDTAITAATWLGLDESTGADNWRVPTFNRFTEWNPAGIGSTDGFTALDVVPVGVHRTTAPVLGDGDVVALQLDTAGNLMVSTAGGAAATQKFVSAAYEASHVSVGAKTLKELFVSSKAVAAGWIFIYDAAALPANGTLPDFPPIPIPAGGFASLLTARPMTNGIVVVFSSTQATLTAATADCWFEAHW
jgi:hypothetical protein